jgi:hypothetical protein
MAGVTIGTVGKRLHPATDGSMAVDTKTAPTRRDIYDGCERRLGLSTKSFKVLQRRGQASVIQVLKLAKTAVEHEQILPEQMYKNNH